MALISRISAQDNSQVGTGPTNITVTYPSATKTGNLLIISAVNNAGVAASATGFTAYSQVIDGGNSELTILYGISTGQTTVVVGMLGASVMEAHGYEYSGAANPIVIDTENKHSSGTTAETTYTTAAITTTLTPDLIFSSIGSQVNAAMQNASWNTSTGLRGNPRLLDGQYLPGTTVTSWTDSVGTFTSTQVSTVTVAFKSMPTGNFLPFM